MKTKLLRKLRKRFVILESLEYAHKFVVCERVLFGETELTLSNLTYRVASVVRRNFILNYMRKHYVHFDR